MPDALLGGLLHEETSPLNFLLPKTLLINPDPFVLDETALPELLLLLLLVVPAPVVAGVRRRIRRIAAKHHKKRKVHREKNLAPAQKSLLFAQLEADHVPAASAYI